MHNQIITIAGATGELGARIAQSLVRRGASVRAIVRDGSTDERSAALRRTGIDVRTVLFDDASGLANAVGGSACVISVLSGLEDVIVGAQTQLLQAAVVTGVPRFIPSDFSCDLTKVPAGSNRNFDLRRRFHEVLATAPIRATSVLNGAFADMLTWERSPLYDFQARCVVYWGSPDRVLDFTTMDDVAGFTAAAALDPHTPRFLRIAGNQASARDLAATALEVFEVPYEITSQGSLDDLAARIASVRLADPTSEQSVFPAFQGMQYLHNMFTGQGRLQPLDNDRYPEDRWTDVRTLLQQRKAAT